MENSIYFPGRKLSDAPVLVAKKKKFVYHCATYTPLHDVVGVAYGLGVFEESPIALLLYLALVSQKLIIFSYSSTFLCPFNQFWDKFVRTSARYIVRPRHKFADFHATNILERLIREDSQERQGQTYLPSLSEVGIKPKPYIPSPTVFSSFINHVTRWLSIVLDMRGRRDPRFWHRPVREMHELCLSVYLFRVPNLITVSEIVLVLTFGPKLATYEVIRAVGED